MNWTRSTLRIPRTRPKGGVAPWNAARMLGDFPTCNSEGWCPRHTRSFRSTAKQPKHSQTFFCHINKIIWRTGSQVECLHQRKDVAVICNMCNNVPYSQQLKQQQWNAWIAGSLQQYNNITAIYKRNTRKVPWDFNKDKSSATTVHAHFFHFFLQWFICKLIHFMSWLEGITWLV